MTYGEGPDYACQVKGTCEHCGKKFIDSKCECTYGEREAEHIEPCAGCGKGGELKVIGRHWWIECSNSECKASGTRDQERSIAIAAWNAMQRAVREKEGK